MPRTGQVWTTPEQLSAAHANTWKLLEPNLFEVYTTPSFAIGQRALLVRTPVGNFLWDCLALIDEATIELIKGLGGLAGIAISHPHYYTCCQDWAAAFDCPIYLHAADREWLLRPSKAVCFWAGDQLVLSEELTLLKLGGHFPGSAVLYWKPQGSPEGVLLSGDTVQVTDNPNRVTFLWSYPNRIPLSANSVRRIAEALRPFSIERVYGFASGYQILREGGRVIQHSAARILHSLALDR